MPSEPNPTPDVAAEPPGSRRLRADLADVPFLIGADEGRWGLVGDPADAWPDVTFWVAAAGRPASPERFGLRLNFEDYPARGPSGCFWDVDAGTWLPPTDWPKGSGRVAEILRRDWAIDRRKRALYHPLDGVTLSTHGGWQQTHAADVWRRDRDVSHYLDMVHRLLNSNDYTGT